MELFCQRNWNDLHIVYVSHNLQKGFLFNNQAYLVMKQNLIKSRRRRKEWRGVEGRDRSLTCNELPTSNILLARDTRISSGSMGRAVNKFESWGRIRNTGPTCYLGCHVALTDTHKARNWELLTSNVPGDHPQLCTKPLRKFWIYSWLIHLNLAVTGKLKWDDF